MKLLLLGATGEIGKCVLRRVQRDLPTAELTILVRNTDKLDELLDKSSQQRVQVSTIFCSPCLSLLAQSSQLNAILKLWF